VIVCAKGRGGKPCATRDEMARLRRTPRGAQGKTTVRIICISAMRRAKGDMANTVLGKPKKVPWVVFAEPRSTQANDDARTFGGAEGKRRGNHAHSHGHAE